MIGDLAADLMRESCRWNTAAWMEGFGMIEKKGGEIERPICNEYQRKISSVVEWAHKNKRPCRIVALKPRQKGSSTVSTAVGHRRAHAKRCRGLIAGGAHFQGNNLFKILKTYAENDELDPKRCTVKDMEADYHNGSTIERITLANANAGRSGTYQFLLITEVAYLAEEGVSNATNVLNGLLKCVPYQADTIIIQESTAKGASGDYYDTYQGGITFEEFKAGKNGYIKIFSPWFEFEDSRMDPASEDIHSEADLSRVERELAEKWELDLWQVAWMRWAIREECKGDFSRFEQDYPFDDESAFLKSGRGRFSSEGLAYQERRSAEVPREFGVLEYSERADRISWRSTTEDEARCVRWENPLVGCRYLISVDSMTGESQVGGDDPDSHAVIVARDGYLDHNRRWHEPAVVMRNILYADGAKRFGCWWDIDVLEEEVWRMARYWQAIIIPEMNMDRGLVELLKLRTDVEIYQRELFNRREQVMTKALGWETTPKTRPMIIEKLATAIREAGRGEINTGFEIRDPWSIKECKNFVVKNNGRAEASQGKHDDSVIALCIAVQNLDQATPWHEQVRNEWVPPDLRGYDNEVISGVGRSQYR